MVHPLSPPRPVPALAHPGYSQVSPTTHSPNESFARGDKIYASYSYGTIRQGALVLKLEFWGIHGENSGCLRARPVEYDSELGSEA